MKTFKKVLYEKEYQCHAFWSSDDAPVIAKSYVKIELFFNFKKGLFFSVSVPNTSYCYSNLFKALFGALEHESIGMAKYNNLKDRVREIDVARKL